MLSSTYSQAISIDNMHVAKVAGIILIILGLYMFFQSERMVEDTKSKDEIKYVAITSMALGGAYLLWTIWAWMRYNSRY